MKYDPSNAMEGYHSLICDSLFETGFNKYGGGI